LLHDPSAGSFWTNYYEDGQDSRVYNRVNTKKGRMIVFPGHIVHSTDLNRTDKSRTAIATNFKVSYD